MAFLRCTCRWHDRNRRRVVQRQPALVWDVRRGMLFSGPYATCRATQTHALPLSLMCLSHPQDTTDAGALPRLGLRQRRLQASLDISPAKSSTVSVASSWLILRRVCRLSAFSFSFSVPTPSMYATKVRTYWSCAGGGGHKNPIKSQFDVIKS